ncbi:MAG: diaminopimelate epimerase [Eubacteriales bacterium]
MKFTKMHGAGNDYIYLYEENTLDLAKVAVQLSSRNKGVGSDGVVHIKKGTDTDYIMQIFNADGSQGEMCGNGIRCLGKYVYDKGYTDKTRNLTVSTLAGVRTLQLEVGDDNKVSTVVVDMGEPEYGESHSIIVDGKGYVGQKVSVGNPHFVIRCDKVEAIDLARIAPQIQRKSIFPDGVNVEFFHVVDENTLAMRVWERGSGETLSCGTGACAVFATARKDGLTPVRADIAQRGGVVTMWQAGNQVMMHGEAVTVFEGEVELEEDFKI